MSTGLVLPRNGLHNSRALHTSACHLFGKAWVVIHLPGRESRRGSAGRRWRSAMNVEAPTGCALRGLRQQSRTAPIQALNAQPVVTARRANLIGGRRLCCECGQGRVPAAGKGGVFMGCAHLSSVRARIIGRVIRLRMLGLRRLFFSSVGWEDLGFETSPLRNHHEKLTD